MRWWRRFLVLTPMAGFVAAAFIMSCGGGGSFAPIPTYTPLSLVSVAICLGPVPTATPTPAPTPTGKHTATPKPTPTLECSPIPEDTIVPLPTPAPGGTPVLLQLNAQGTFVTGNKSKPKYQDITNHNSTDWLLYGAGLINPHPGATPYGEYITNGTGCACISVTAGGGAIASQKITVGIPDAGSCPSYCATPTPTP